jgi:DNA-binding transcriptional LysR family regulator
MTGSSPPALRSDWLAAFVVFAEHLNFTRAAAALHLSQPALHVQIAKLSEEVGLPLYVRRGRGLQLTAQGRKLLAFARDAAERSREFVAGLRGGSAGDPIVLCAGEGTYSYLLLDSLRAFVREGTAPLRLLTRDRGGTIEAVLSGEAHLGVTSLETVPEGAVATALCQVPQVVVLPRAHPLAGRRVVAVADLNGLSLVVPPEGLPQRTAIERAFADAGVAFSVAAEARGWELVLRFAALGVGGAIVNGFCPAPKGMVARRVRDLPLVRYSVIARAGAHRSASVQTLRQFIIAGAERTSSGPSRTLRR